MSTRHRAREFVLKALYAFELGSQTEQQIIETVIADSGLDDKTRIFAQSLFSLVVKNLAAIDLHIQELAENWALERMAVVDKNVMRMAVCEVEYMPDIPVKVAVNEAIELAKKYSTIESASFVNGILDKVMQRQEAKEKS
jgi:transcription antitermination factor NusB